MIFKVVTGGFSMLVLAACLDSSRVHAQTASTGADRSIDRFLSKARKGTSRYHDQDAAVADGYKPVGVEFPAMGTHWVNLAHVLADSLVAERPSVLIYVDVAGKPRLAGVAYTDLFTAGEAPPGFPAPGGWHEHNGSVAEESFPLAHDVTHSSLSRSSASDPEVRLAVLHAWLWSPNPAGVFVTDNWALPALRLGFHAPTSTPRAALRALALATDDDGYMLLTLRTGLGLSMADETVAASVLEEQRAAARRDIASMQAGDTLTAEISARLVARWSATWTSLERALPQRAARIRALRHKLH